MTFLSQNLVSSTLPFFPFDGYESGNLTSGDGAKTYKYDAENRVIEIDYVGTSNKSVFAYDGMGHRIKDAETVSGTTTATYTLFCGDPACQQRNAGNVATKIYYPEGEYNITTGQKLVYLPDQLGSVRDVVDATSGTRVASYDYTPYGAVARSSVTNATDFQFAGLYAHAPSGLGLATYRFLDGATGRWTNRDPIREVGGLNLYSYVGANPIMENDPYGLWAIYLGLSFGGGNYIGGSGSSGLVIDSSGNLGTYETGQIGGISKGGFGGIQIGLLGSTNHKETTICDFAGPFENASEGIGRFKKYLYGSIDGFIDPENDGFNNPGAFVGGGGITIGVGTPGVSGSVTTSNTWVNPRGNIWSIINKLF